MKSKSKRSLKATNLKWLFMLVATDIIIINLLISPNFDKESFESIGVPRFLMATIIPIFVMLVVNLLPHDIKALLVYWKPLGVMPGSEAFTKYGPRDIRIDMSALQKNVGRLPVDPSEQNRVWYKLYKLVSQKTEVMEAHKLYLLYRDMATISLFLLVVVPVFLFFTKGLVISSAAGGIFAIQFLVAALNARWSGIRFVCNVLSIHSVKKVSATRRSAKKSNEKSAA